MSPIRLLPDHLINKIAAGEVVERPASVVKELVENAIDAGGRVITVELKDAGRQLIRVTDDGFGMTGADLDMALRRHATSKITDEGDLAAIATLGFRGEALPAICAVSRFEILSCPRGGAVGALVRGAGGTVADRLEVEAAPGTSVETQDLFFNTPARLKFLRSAPAELAFILRLLHGIALSRPDLHLRALHHGKAVLTAPAAATLRDRVGAVLGFETAEAMLEVEHTQGSVRVTGLAAPPQRARGNRDEITLIVNGRPVRDTALAQGLIEAYAAPGAGGGVSRRPGRPSLAACRPAPFSNGGPDMAPVLPHHAVWPARSGGGVRGPRSKQPGRVVSRNSGFFRARTVRRRRGAAPRDVRRRGQ